MLNLKRSPIFIAGILLGFGVYKMTFKSPRVIFLQEGFFKRGVGGLMPSAFFMCFCLSIGLRVLIFRNYYMPTVEVRSFTSTLLVFIILMVGLTNRSNMLSIFLGWEGVGVLSFILICWFSSRENAVSGAKKAVLFNRLTDFFFLFVIVWEMGELSFFFIDTSYSAPLWGSGEVSTLGLTHLLVFAFFIRTAGKSAQFMFHPWLTAAMEGPTPVRRLLHRRTMVVAGVFLFFFLSPYLERFGEVGSSTNKLILWSSLLTLLGSSFWAFSQVDIKKIIALSTTRQLRMIIVLIALGLADLAFLHIILHGFFKAIIFMGSGVAIHGQQDSQDVRKVGGLQNSPFLGVFFFLGNLGLMGIPFLGASWRKHIILDEIKNQVETRIILGFFVLSFSLTVGYSLKRIKAIYSGGAVKRATIPHKIQASSFSEVGPTFFLGGMVFLAGGAFTPLFLERRRNLTKDSSQFLDLSMILLIGGILFLSLGFSNFLLTFFFSGELVLFHSGLIKILRKISGGMILESHFLKFHLKNMRQSPFFFKKNPEEGGINLPPTTPEKTKVKEDLLKGFLFFLGGMLILGAL